MSEYANTYEFLRNALTVGKTEGYTHRQTEAIEANPAALLDAMVDDGMARAVVWCPVWGHHIERSSGHHIERDSCKSADQHITRYEVTTPKPHVHDWLFTGTNGRTSRVDRLAYWSCRSCAETATTDIEPPS